MNDAKLWYVGAVLFLVAAVVSAVGSNWVMAAAFVVIAVLFLYSPRYLAGRGNRRL